MTVKELKVLLESVPDDYDVKYEDELKITQIEVDHEYQEVTLESI